MAAHTGLFQTLKPTCVALSETVLSYRSGPQQDKQLIQRLEELAKLLQSIRKSSRREQIDAKYAEYVFFPLSHVLRQRQHVPIRSLELCLQCLLALLQTGWSNGITPDLGIQLMILSTFVASTSEDGSETSKTSEELLAVDFACLAAVIRSLSATRQGRNALVSVDNVPAVGHAVTVSLEIASSSEVQTVQIEALDTLKAFADGLERSVLASFLPGIVSTLTKILTPTASRRTSFKTLARGVDLCSFVLPKVLNDDYSFDSSPRTEQPPSTLDIPRLSQPWRAATAGQLKLALANIVKLRSHDRREVRASMASLCTTLLQKCSHNFQEVVPLLVDTLIVISCGDQEDVPLSRLRMLLIENEQLVEHLKACLYDAILALPRTTLSNDPSKKQLASGYVETSCRLLQEMGCSIPISPSILLSSLRDAAVGARQDADVSANGHTARLAISPSLSIQTSRGMNSMPTMSTNSEHGHENLRLLTNILHSVSASEESLEVVRSCLDDLSSHSDDDALPLLWMALTMLKRRASLSEEADEFLNLDACSGPELQLREQLYANAVSILTRPEDNLSTTKPTTNLHALALEAIAFQSSLARQDFRSELSDVLYPVLQYLGSPDTELRSHAMESLDIIASSTGYSSSQELIIDNNDYLVNGVGLKLSTFDLSPQAPQVLNMLIRLCGAKLLPYLDDLTDNIFEALECFHGYDSLVRLLFQCLGAMVEEGVRAPALTIEGVERANHRLKPVQSTIINELTQLLQSIHQKTDDKRHEKDQEESEMNTLPSNTPHKPWKDVEEDSPDDAEEPAAVEETSDEKPAPLTKAYHLIHRIAELIQHHIPSGDATTRAHLCYVLTTALPYLSHHEDTFLPLIHTLWPVLVPRLEDIESSVVAGTLEVMAKMAEGAGSFVRGRVADIWDEIQRIHRHVQADLEGRDSKDQLSTSLAAPSDSRTPKRLISQVDIGAITESGPTISGRPQKEGTMTSTSEALIPTSSRSLKHSSSGAQTEQFSSKETEREYIGGRYISTTALTLRRALTRFLVSLLTHVEVPAWLSEDIMSNMLLPYLIYDKRECPWIDEDMQATVKAALEERNADAVWLMTLRYGKWPEEETRLRENQPTNVPGAIEFRPYVQAW